MRKPVDSLTIARIVRRAADAYAMRAENERLHAEIARANRRLERENAYLRRRIRASEENHGILGESAQLKDALQILHQVQRGEATVHICGETGTGKELVARAIHDGSRRSKASFVPQNCAGMTESLLESTLFGHVKGAFTGADRDRPGLFQAAHGGTLFLEEIAELPMAVQAGLLRVVQAGEVKPVGASRPTKVDVRLVSATHKDLRQEVEEGRFRADLYFRLVVIDLTLPPLRDRVGDVPILARHFLDQLCERLGGDIPGFSPEAMEALERYAWPGNVRELRNEIERLTVLAEPGEKLRKDLLSPRIRDAAHSSVRAWPRAAEPSAVVPDGLSYDEAMEALQRRLVESALAEESGVVSRAAARLGMERTRLAKLRRRLGL